MSKHRVILLLVLLALGVMGGRDASACCVSLSWTAPGDDGMLGQATKYEIRYSLQPVTESNWHQAAVAGWVPSPSYAGIRQSAVVTNLLVGRRYYFAIRARDDVGNWSGISNVVSAVVQPDVCTGITGNVNCDPLDRVNLTDLTAMIDHLFASYRPLACPSEADVDGVNDINLTDVTYLVHYLYRGGPQPVPCQ